MKQFVATHSLLIHFAFDDFLITSILLNTPLCSFCTRQVKIKSIVLHLNSWNFLSPIGSEQLFPKLQPSISSKSLRRWTHHFVSSLIAPHGSVSPSSTGATFVRSRQTVKCFPGNYRKKPYWECFQVPLLHSWNNLRLERMFQMSYWWWKR